MTRDRSAGRRKTEEKLAGLCAVMKRLCNCHAVCSPLSIGLCYSSIAVFLITSSFLFLAHSLIQILPWAHYSTISSGMDLRATADAPSGAWRRLSSATMFGVGALCRAFLLAGNYPEFHGLDAFMQLLDSRRNAPQRCRGLLTGKRLSCVRR